MINSITNLNSAIIALRKYLIINSELDSSRVLNSLSLNGTELDKLLEDSIYNSIESSNDTLLFEVSENESNSNMSEDDNENNDIIYYKMYTCHIIIYGDNSDNIALKLASRMRSNVVIDAIYNDGIYIEDISNPQSINEFKNNLMWFRTDFDISFGVRYSISHIIEDYNIEKIDNLNIIKEEN